MVKAQLDIDLSAESNAILPPLDALDFSTSNANDVDVWISAGTEVFRECNVLSFERPSIKNFASIAFFPFIRSTVTYGTEESPQTVNFVGTIEPEDVTNANLSNRLYFPVDPDGNSFFYKVGDNWSDDQFPDNIGDEGVAGGYTYCQVAEVPN